MSYYEQAKKINQDIEQLFNSLYIREFTQQQRENILNLMIRIGQVAKYRCRNNSAYDNFIRCCFENIATVQRVPIKEGEDFEVLKATLKPLTSYFDFLAKNGKEDNKESFTEWAKTKNMRVI